jgi:hypothetical protein
MKNLRVWVFGDSFSASTDKSSWVKQIPNVKLKSFNGSSEYRIWKTYQDNKHLIKPHDKVIFCHTSESRVFLKDDAELSSRKLISHPKCDLLVNDVLDKNEEPYVSLLRTIWDDDYLADTYSLLVEDLKKVPNSTHFTFFQSSKVESLYDIWQSNKGHINHMNIEGNRISLDKITKLMNPIKRIVTFGASIALGQGLEYPDTQSYTALIAKKLNVSFDNQAIPGASSLGILHKILNYEYQEGDCVIILWGPPYRDMLFLDKKTTINMGPWDIKDSELHSAWVKTHSPEDLVFRTWMNIQHSSLFLKNKNIKHYNFTGDNPVMKPKPDFIDVELYNTHIDKLRFITNKAKDNLHPGEAAHEIISNFILKRMGYK